MTGELSAQVWPNGQRNFYYDQDTGNLDHINFPSGSLLYTYDGSLLKSEQWTGTGTGTVAGSVSRTYDSSFRISTQQVNNANPVTFTYDNDDLLTAVALGTSNLTLTRSAQTGLLTASTLGVVSDSYGYNSFGEVTSYSANVSGTPIFSVTYTRDGLGRISAKTEAIQGVTDSYGYTYDPAGRLTDVTKNSTAIAHYDYDPNGNRSGGFNQVSGTLLSATYDNQDRLVSAQSSILGPQSWAYTANGELQTKTDPSGT